MKKEELIDKQKQKYREHYGAEALAAKEAQAARLRPVVEKMRKGMQDIAEMIRGAE